MTVWEAALERAYAEIGQSPEAPTQEYATWAAGGVGDAGGLVGWGKAEVTLCGRDDDGVVVRVPVVPIARQVTLVWSRPTLWEAQIFVGDVAASGPITLANGDSLSVTFGVDM